MPPPRMRPRRHRLDNDPVRVLLRVLIVAAVVIALIAVETSSRSGCALATDHIHLPGERARGGVLPRGPCSLPARIDRASVRGAVVLYVVVAGIIWNLLLDRLQHGIHAGQHSVAHRRPGLVTVDWLVVGRGQRRVRWWQPLVWLIYPAAYVVLALLVLNRAGRRAPYYFLDPDSVGMAAVVTNIGLLAVFILVLGYGISAVGRPRRAGSPVVG